MDLERKRMVEEQVQARGISDKRVLVALLKVQRHIFVPEDEWPIAYGDFPLPIGFGQTISQPYIVAYMTEILRLKSTDKVLEIGTGCGYQAAVLAEIVNEVYTVEVIPELAKSAAQKLQELGYQNIHVKQANGFEGWKEFAPFDAIIVTAAPEEIPKELLRQLKVGGRMVIPVGSFFQELHLITKTDKGIETKKDLPVRFVPMIRGKEQK